MRWHLVPAVQNNNDLRAIFEIPKPVRNDTYSLAPCGRGLGRGGQKLASLVVDYHVTPSRPMMPLSANFPRNDMIL